MKCGNIVADKSFHFAVRIVNVFKYLSAEKEEHVLSQQLLRSGTSIGANIAEAECAVSRNDFIAKLYIAFKESAETLFWLRLLHETQYLSDGQYESLAKDCNELKALLSSITKTARQKAENI